MLIEAKIKAMNLLNEIEGVKKDIELICSKNDIKIINRNINILKNTLGTNNADMINKKIDELNKSTESFAQKKIDKDFSKVLGTDITKIDNL